MVKSTLAALLLLPQLAAATTEQHHTRSFSSRPLNHRRQTVPTNLPGNWTSLGCFTDQGGARTLGGSTYASGNAMTAGACIAYCEERDFIYAGTEFGIECFCGNNLANGSTNTTLSECNMPCSGDSTQPCGAGGRLNVYWSGEEPPPGPETVESVGDWVSLGCYSDEGGVRTLPTAMGVTGQLTIESCTSACFTSGYQFAGAEYSRECFCGSAIGNNGAPRPLADCNMICDGNPLQFCGGPGRLNLYNYTADDLPPINNPGPGPNPGTPVFPVDEGLPGTWEYVGCFVDNRFGRILTQGYGADGENTVASCIDQCIGAGYNVSGTEFGAECFCGNAILNDGALATADTQCSMGCAGNSTQACGAGDRMSIYAVGGNVTIYPVPLIQKDELPGEWEYQGCYPDFINNQRTLKYQVLHPTNLSATHCLERCGAYGYPAAGLEYGTECWCGDVEDMEVVGAEPTPEADCSFICSGDPFHTCGGAQRLQMYYWKGENNRFDVWHTPEVTGWYGYITPGVVIPLISTVGINGKISFLEKTGTSSFENSTGGYEYDISLAGDFSKAYREMHPRTDVFCGASIVLPDRAGRQINVGGWSLVSTFGIRLYAPDGVLGVNGTNDWEEEPDSLQLQRGRWYPTVILMQNSSILVVGGQTGENAPPQPNLEILPKPEGGDTVVHLDWLDTPNQDVQTLYPFMYVLRDGSIFISYWHQARILDPVDFSTVTILPDSPGSVDRFLSGRNYPLEGSATIFPQYAPYDEPLTILMCGGSNPLGNGEALDNCVSIQPEVEEPTWLLERMPSKRVLSCFAALPDGTYLLVNGAHAGVAGFGLADDANFQAVLYDPARPPNQRMSILNSTTIARMYHSEATLLMDGRILISGSDPQDQGKHPQELRLEVYIPPYLATGLRQPTFNRPAVSDWDFGGSYTITNITLFQGTMANLRVSLMASSSSTHGLTTGGRTIFPEFSCTGRSCTIVAPPLSACPPSWHMLFILDGPTPSHATWVRIGGDPASLGDWPELPGFAPPGADGPLMPHV